MESNYAMVGGIGIVVMAITILPLIKSWWNAIIQNGGT